MEITATEMKNNMGQYLRECKHGPIYITKNGKVAAKLVDYTYDLAVDRVEIIRDALPVYGDRDDFYTYEAFIAMTEASEERYELIDGEVFMLASPRFEHQYALSNLNEAFTNYFADRPCKNFFAPLDIQLDRGIEGRDPCVVQPDLMVLCDWKDNIGDDGKYKGTPTLVIEILSPSTKRHDLVRKLDLYMNTGIKEYWAVDLEQKMVLVYSFTDKSIEMFKVFKEKEKVMSHVFEGLELAAAKVFM